MTEKARWMRFMVPAEKCLVRPGDRFTRWVVAGESFYAISSGRRVQSVVCKCDCGKYGICVSSFLRSLKTKSCGCLISDMAAKRNYRHGLSSSPIWGVWSSMIARCSRVTHHAYANYGGRGIGVCREWQDSFVAFYDWAVSCGYQRGLSIDRINNALGYSPDNCRWASLAVQNSNKRGCVYLTAFGETKTMAEWSRDPRAAVSADTLGARVKLGWKAETAITKKAR